KGAVYAHFTSKAELYLLVVDEVLADAELRLDSVVERVPDGANAPAVAAAYFTGEDAEHAAILTDMWQVATVEPAVRARLEGFRRSREARLGGAFVDAGRSPGEATELARTVAALIDARLLDERLGMGRAAG